MNIMRFKKSMKFVGKIQKLKQGYYSKSFNQFYKRSNNYTLKTVTNKIYFHRMTLYLYNLQFSLVIIRVSKLCSFLQDLAIDINIIHLFLALVVARGSVVSQF